MFSYFSLDFVLVFFSVSYLVNLLSSILLQIKPYLAVFLSKSPLSFYLNINIAIKHSSFMVFVSIYITFCFHSFTCSRSNALKLAAANDKLLQSTTTKCARKRTYTLTIGDEQKLLNQINVLCMRVISKENQQKFSVCF